MIVVDTSVLASLWIPNETEELAFQVLRKDPEWIAPLLWKSELRSVFALYLRKEMLDLSTVFQSMQEAENLMDTHTYEVHSTQVLQLVHRSGCSAYDCEFVALADDLDIPLITFNKQICREFPTRAVLPEAFVTPRS